MMEDDLNRDNLPAGDGKPTNETKPPAGMYIVGYNLLGLAAYTALFGFASGGGFILDAVVLFVHVVICIILALANRSWIWLLSGLLVLAIGFSTCVMMASHGGI